MRHFLASNQIMRGSTSYDENYDLGNELVPSTISQSPTSVSKRASTAVGSSTTLKGFPPGSGTAGPELRRREYALCDSAPIPLTPEAIIAIARVLGNYD